MSGRSAVGLLVILAASRLAAAPPVPAQDIGASVTVRGAVRENLYAAGGEVDVRAEVDGDAVAAGGRVRVDGTVRRDALVAGGDVTVAGRIGDDVRAAGGMVTVSGPVGGEVLAAGGRVRLAPEAAVAGRVRLAGGAVEVEGRVGGPLMAAGGTIRLDGQVEGDVTLVGREIAIGPAARIGGRLVYRSPHPARIDPGARIAGEVTHLLPEFAARAAGVARTASIVLSVVGLLALMATGVVLWLVFPRFLGAAARGIATDFWKSLGLGLAVLLAVPVVGFALLLTVLGIPLAFTLMAAYAVALLVGVLVSAGFLGDVGLRLLRPRRPASPGARIAGLLGALVALAVARWIPLAGGLILFLALVVGLGALALEARRAYGGRAGRTTATP